ncbi:Baseplate J-like protein [compost metagenome]
MQPAQILRYRIRAIAWINPGPDSGLTETAAVAAMQAYATARHRLEGYVDPAWIDAGLITAGAERLQRLEPLAPIAAAAHQAPYCEAIEIEVRTL